jgi:hypothetical protein
VTLVLSADLFCLFACVECLALQTAAAAVMADVSIIIN